MYVSKHINNSIQSQQSTKSCTTSTLFALMCFAKKHLRFKSPATQEIDGAKKEKGSIKKSVTIFQIIYETVYAYGYSQIRLTSEVGEGN